MATASLIQPVTPTSPMLRRDALLEFSQVYARCSIRAKGYVGYRISHHHHQQQQQQQHEFQSVYYCRHIAYIGALQIANVRAVNTSNHQWAKKTNDQIENTSLNAFEIWYSHFIQARDITRHCPPPFQANNVGRQCRALSQGCQHCRQTFLGPILSGDIFGTRDIRRDKIMSKWRPRLSATKTGCVSRPLLVPPLFLVVRKFI